MQISVDSCTLELVMGDITAQEVDAVVNAANSRLAGGGGVDGAIHRAAGPEVMMETRRKFPEGCRTGHAVPTAGGDLPAKYIFHAVGPVWSGGASGEPELLASAYKRCLELALEHDCRSIAFPAISTGVYGYPMDLAARTALATVKEFLRNNGRPELVRFALFGEGAYGAFAAALESLAQETAD